MIDVFKTVREFAVEQTSSIRIFERFGLDYLREGNASLNQACAAQGISVDEVAAALNAADSKPANSRFDWAQVSLEHLIEHIVKTYHKELRTELPRLSALAQKAVSRHGDKELHLLALQDVLAQLGKELTQHLEKEENVLFPCIVKLEAAKASGSRPRQSCFVSVANPIGVMTGEHDNTCEMLAAFRRLSNNFTPPAGASSAYRDFYEALSRFDKNLRQHMHLENNILFPRAIELEAEAQAVA